MINQIPEFVKGPYPDMGIKKLIADFKTYLTELETLADVSLKTLVNDIRVTLKGDYLLSLPGLATGGTSTDVASAAFSFIIGGVQYSKGAVAAGTPLSGDNIPQNLYGAWRLEIGADGTIDIVAATGNAAGYATAVLAAAGLPALSASHASMGVVTAMDTAAVFDPGTTALDAVTVTEAYTDGLTVFQAIGGAVM